MILERMKMNHTNDIPKEWQIKTLGDVILDSVGGGTPSTKIQAYWGGDIHWMTSKRLSDKLYLYDGEKRISKRALDETSVKLVPEGNVIVSTRVTVGKAMVNTIDMAINQDLTGLLIDRKLCSPEFIAYQLKSSCIQSFFDSQKRGATIKGITREDLKKVDLMWPPLQEQQVIANVLLLIQSAIENQEKIIRTTTVLKRALMQKLFTEGLRGEKQNQTEIGLIPVNWDVLPISEAVRETETRYPGREPTKKIKYIDVSSVSNQSFSVVGHAVYSGAEAPGRARKVVNTNDIIFATIRPTLRRIAKISEDYDDEYSSTAFCVLRAEEDRLNYEYLYQYILTDSFSERISKHQSGASYPAVRDDDVKAMKIPLPPLDEQSEIASIFQKIDEKLILTNKKLDCLSSLFQSMLCQLMMGQIRVEDLDLKIKEAVVAT